jgi:UDP-N-acetylmuramoyl-tripeptide--D-alanyl-D-alanine ligase
MNAALDNFCAMNFAHKTAILGDMLELGAETLKKHQQIIEKLVECNFDSVFLIGENFQKCSSDFKTFNSRADFENFLKKTPITNSAILIKGSHGIGLEKLVEFL